MQIAEYIRSLQSYEIYGFSYDDVLANCVAPETERIFKTLYKKYDKDKVLERIEKGHLLVCSYKLIFNNF
ncbi:MAG: hypothetical protein HYU67_12075 [Flavobacteriia bacterium]|nr:hypothetical protein [Flavobacteriia bacterium]